MARRMTPCPRNLDDLLRVAALGLSIQSLGLTFSAMLLFIGLEVAGGLFSLFFGHWGFAAVFVATILVALALRQIEQHDDQYYVPSLVAYYLTRGDGPSFWRRVLYSPGAPEEFDGYCPPEANRAKVLVVAFGAVMVLVLQAALRFPFRWWGVLLGVGLPLGWLVVSERAARLECERHQGEWAYRAYAALGEAGE